MSAYLRIRSWSSRFFLPLDFSLAGAFLPDDFEAAPPIAADPGGFPDFRIWGFSENADLWNFPVRFGVWEVLQSMGNGCGLQMDGFSVNFKPSDSISIDFHDFGLSGVVCGGLMLFPEGPRTLRECPEGPGTL